MEIIDIFQILAAGHQQLTIIDYLFNALAGAVGALTAYLASNEGEVFLPRYDEEEHSIELGALGRVLVGAGAGVIVGYSGFVPFAAGIITPAILPYVLDKLMERFGRGK
jgi:hypothetical protein